jgi:hypothetical protein
MKGLKTFLMVMRHAITYTLSVQHIVAAKRGGLYGKALDILQLSSARYQTMIDSLNALPEMVPGPYNEIVYKTFVAHFKIGLMTEKYDLFHPHQAIISKPFAFMGTFMRQASINDDE